MNLHLKYLDKCPTCNAYLNHIPKSEYLKILEHNESYEQVKLNCPICDVLIVFKIWIN